MCVVPVLVQGRASTIYTSKNRSLENGRLFSSASFSRKGFLPLSIWDHFEDVFQTWNMTGRKGFLLVLYRYRTKRHSDSGKVMECV